MERFEKCDESRSLRWVQVLSIGGHIAATLQDLPHELICRQPDGNRIESRPALTPDVANGVAVVTLLRLKYERSLDLNRRATIQKSRWDGSAGRGVHHGTPRRMIGHVCKRSQRNSDQ